jgi:hypothetical protein
VIRDFIGVLDLDSAAGKRLHKAQSIAQYTSFHQTEKRNSQSMENHGAKEIMENSHNLVSSLRLPHPAIS